LLQTLVFFSLLTSFDTYIMMRSFLLLALAIAAVTAFAPPARHGVIMATQRPMFSPNADEIAESPSPLEVVVEGESIAPVVVDTPQSTIAPRTMVVKNLAKGGEVKQGESQS
jgi:hypothetical protein